MLQAIIRKCLVGAICFSILAPSPRPFNYTKAATTQDFITNEAETGDNANSFRYQNGEPTKSPSVFSLKSASTQSNAWTKINGSFVNSNLEPIEGATQKGIDVSHHQGEIDWQKVSKTDVDYAIIRCGYGQDLTSQDDKYWKTNADACTKYNIPFGTYLYSYATTVEKAIGEAKHVLRLIEGYDLQYPIYYDLEDVSLQNLSKATLGKIAAAFCETIENAGYEAAIYANTDWFTNRLTDPVFNNWDRWVAQYNAICKYTGFYNMWQCTSTGKVSGINGNVDLNFVIGNEPVAQVSKVTLDTNAISLLPKESKTLTPSISPKNAYNKSVSWSSSDSSVATVKNGTVTAVAPGNAIITATSKDGTQKKASCTITVQADTNESNIGPSNSNPNNSSGTDSTASNTSPDATAPKAVASFSYKADSTSSIELSWKKVPEADGYTLYRPNGKAIKTLSKSTTSYTVRKNYGESGTTLKAGTTYTFMIAPYKTANNKKIYGKKVTLKATTKPKNTTLKTVVKSTSAKTKLTWSKTSSATGYVIYYSTKKSSGYKALKTISSNKTTSYITASLKKGKTYYIKLATYRKLNNKTIYGGYSNIKSIKR